MQKKRVISLVDGFNLYHAIDRLKHPEFKWLDLMALSKLFIASNTEELRDVYYFSAYAHHRSEPTQIRQKTYVQALELQGVQTVLGNFKRKDRRCPSCNHKWKAHEEKETDVNIALFLIDLAYHDIFDRALIISNDSDLTPAIKLIKQRFSNKQITAVAPPHCRHSNELINASSNKAKINLTSSPP